MRLSPIYLVLLLSASAMAQHPGHLGKPAPSTSGKRVNLGALPKWPRRSDPTPMRTTHYLDVTVEFRGGAIRVAKLVKGRFEAGPKVIPRFRGRFELRVHAHGLLLDVVRFDLPLTAAAEDQNPRLPGDTRLGDRLGLGLATGVTARSVVRIPFDDRFTHAAIHDTLTHKVVKIDLPPVLAPTPRTRGPDDLRTRSFGKDLDTSVIEGKPESKPVKPKPVKPKPVRK